MLSAAQNGRSAGLCFMAEAAAIDAPHRLPAGRSRMTFTQAAKALTLQRPCHGQVVRTRCRPSSMRSKFAAAPPVLGADRGPSLLVQSIGAVGCRVPAALGRNQLINVCT